MAKKSEIINITIIRGNAFKFVVVVRRYPNQILARCYRLQSDFCEKELMIALAKARQRNELGRGESFSFLKREAISRDEPDRAPGHI